MSRHELVQGYLDGQLSRRVFIRRLVATGVSAGAAITYAGLLESDPASAAATNYYLVITDNAFDTPVTLRQDQGVEFANHGSNVHNARDRTGLDLFETANLAPQASEAIPPLPGAGAFRYGCDFHPGMVGTLRVPVVATPGQGPLGTSFTIRWALAAPPAGYRFDVQRRRPGTTNFVDWRTGVVATSASFRPGARGFWAFRARVRRPAPSARSEWSAVRTIKVT